MKPTLPERIRAFIQDPTDPRFSDLVHKLNLASLPLGTKDKTALAIRTLFQQDPELGKKTANAMKQRNAHVNSIVANARKLISEMEERGNRLEKMKKIHGYISFDPRTKIPPRPRKRS